MNRNLIRFSNLLFAALGFGLTLAHTLELPGKRKLDGAEWLAVQHTFYGGFAIVGGIAEVLGLCSAILALVMLRTNRTARVGTAIAAVCFLGMLGCYWFGNRPINADVAAWTATTLPADWMTYRDRWDAFHATSTVFAAVAFVALAFATLSEAPPTGARERATDPAQHATTHYGTMGHERR